MLTFSTSEDTKSLKIANVREIAIAYTIRLEISVSVSKNFFEGFWKNGRKHLSPHCVNDE